MARSYLGRDDRGNLGFDLGDGGPPVYLPPTAETAKAAMQFELEAGRDPSLVLAPRRGAMSPDALAQGGTSAPDGRKDSIMWSPPPAAPQRPSVVLDVAPLPAAQPAQPMAPLTIESGPGNVSAAKASGMSQPQIDARLKRQDAAAAAPAPAPVAPLTPGLSAGDPSKGLVATPGGGARATAPADPYANLNPAERQLANLYDAKAQQELAKRPSAGTLVKGGKVQTGESWQGVVGPNDDTLAAQRANAAEMARLGKAQAEAYGRRDEAVAQIQGEQAAYEQTAAQVQAEIAQRKQTALEGIAGQARAIQQKIAAAEIDPNRWYAQKSTGERIGIGIAMALSGALRGLTRSGLGQPNPVLEQMTKLQAKDIDIQVRNIDKQRGDLNDLQRVYVQTKEQFGDEALAADATKLAGLAGFKARIAQEAAKADAVQMTDPAFKKEQLAEMAEMEAAMRVALGGDTPLAQRAAEARMQQLAARTKSYSVRSKLLELDVERKALAERAALEERMNGALSKSYGFTQDRVVGGSSGPSIDRVIATQKAKADMLRGADNDAAKNAGKDEPKMLFVDGAPLPAAKGASAGSVDKAQDLITFADQGLDLVASARARAKQGGGMVPGDPRLKLAAAGIASVLSNAQGGGAPNDNVMKTINDALTPGPRQQEAVNELEGEFISAKRRAMQRVGAAKLWLPR